MPAPASLPRLVILDDDPLVAALVASVGQGVGFDPQVLHEGRELVADLPRLGDAALVLDIVMPDMDGLEVLSLLGEAGFRGPILILSASDPLYLQAATRMAQRQGLRVAGVLSKPIGVPQLVECLEGMRPSAPPSAPGP